MAEVRQESERIYVSAWPDVDVLGSWECTPLFIASVQGPRGHYAHVWMPRPTDSLLHFTLQPIMVLFYGHLQVAQTLIEHNANINIQTDVGQSPLHLAASGKNIPMVEQAYITLLL